MMSGVWGHTALQPGGQSWEGGLVIMSRSQTLGISCWQVPTLRVLAALSPSTVRVDGLVAALCHVGCAYLRSGLVSLSVGRSCSSDPRWPWRMRATTASCAGSRRGPGAGESAHVREPGRWLLLGFVGEIDRDLGQRPCPTRDLSFSDGCLMLLLNL